MAPQRASRGTVVQAEDPWWSSLEAILGTELAGWFMWMCEVRLDNGRRVDAYKHVTTRRYLHLSAAGSAYRYSVEGRYLRIDLASAITTAFEGWQRAAPRPRDLQLLAAAVVSARRLAA
jgi:hypothetical protein